MWGHNTIYHFCAEKGDRLLFLSWSLLQTRQDCPEKKSSLSPFSPFFPLRDGNNGLADLILRVP